MKILFAAAECAPLAKVGGLGDVVGSLPKALLELGVDVRVILPRYKTIHESMGETVATLETPFGNNSYKVTVRQTRLPGSQTAVYLLDEPAIFGGADVYNNSDATPGGEGETRKFLFFSACVTQFLKQQIFQPDLLHIHDWHAALLPLLLKVNQLSTPTLLTIHNLAMQGRASKNLIAELDRRLLEEPGLKQSMSADENVNMLRCGILCANAISTVSPSYAREILSHEFSEGLENEIKQRSPVSGILNGIDETVWNESNDPLITDHYDRFSAELKLLDKAELQQQLGLAINPEIPLLGVVSRLTGQKGFDLLEPIRGQLEALNFQMVILGVGEPAIEAFFKELCQKHPDRFALQEKFDERLAHRIYAASDIFLMPSRFEPCGLGQLIAMHYGSIPLVRATGGLKDSVKGLETGAKNTEEATGFAFEPYDPKALLGQVIFAIDTYKNNPLAWHRLQHNAMAADFSWKKSAKQYLNLYKNI